MAGRLRLVPGADGQGPGRTPAREGCLSLKPTTTRDLLRIRGDSPFRRAKGSAGLSEWEIGPWREFESATAFPLQRSRDPETDQGSVDRLVKLRPMPKTAPP